MNRNNPCPYRCEPSGQNDVNFYLSDDDDHDDELIYISSIVQRCDFSSRRGWGCQSLIYTYTLDEASSLNETTIVHNELVKFIVC